MHAVQRDVSALRRRRAGDRRLLGAGWRHDSGRRPSGCLLLGRLRRRGRTVRRLSRTLVALFAGLLVLTGCGFSGGGGNGYISGNGSIREFPVSQRQQVGPVSGHLLTGGSFDLRSWRGKVVVVNVWGSWCADCRAEAGHLQKAYQSLTKTYGSDVAFLGIDNQDPSPDNGIAFERRFGITYPSLFDQGGRTL